MTRAWRKQWQFDKLLGEDPEKLPYESLDEFDKLKSNPPFPTDFNDETENEIARRKRSNSKGLFSKKNKKNNKMDETIRDTPVDVQDNSKFHGFNVLNDLARDEE